MENEKRSNRALDLVEYTSALAVLTFLFIGTYSLYCAGGDPAVLGVSDSSGAAVASAGSGLPIWLGVVLAFLLIMFIVVIFTIVLSHATIRKMKRA